MQTETRADLAAPAHMVGLAATPGAADHSATRAGDSKPQGMPQGALRQLRLLHWGRADNRISINDIISISILILLLLLTLLGCRSQLRLQQSSETLGLPLRASGSPQEQETTAGAALKNIIIIVIITILIVAVVLVIIHGMTGMLLLMMRMTAMLLLLVMQVHPQTETLQDLLSLGWLQEQIPEHRGAAVDSKKLTPFRQLLLLLLLVGNISNTNMGGDDGSGDCLVAVVIVIMAVVADAHNNS